MLVAFPPHTMVEEFFWEFSMNKENLGSLALLMVLASACGSRKQNSPAPAPQPTPIPAPSLIGVSNEPMLNGGIWVSETTAGGFWQILKFTDTSAGEAILQIRKGKDMVSEGRMRYSFQPTKLVLDVMSAWEETLTTAIVLPAPPNPEYEPFGHADWTIFPLSPTRIKVRFAGNAIFDPLATFGFAARAPLYRKEEDTEWRKLDTAEFESQIHAFNCTITPDSSMCRNRTLEPTPCDAVVTEWLTKGEGRDGKLGVGDWYPFDMSQGVLCRVIPANWTVKR